jgi:uncharacterized protein YpiB (UPF0302 family)
LERPKDLAYASETKVSKGKERGAIAAVSSQSPNVTKRLIPNADKDPYRHRILKTVWIQKKALEDDIDDALAGQRQEDFHHLVQQYKQLNQ